MRWESIKHFDLIQELMAEHFMVLPRAINERLVCWKTGTEPNPHGEISYLSHFAPLEDPR